MSKGIETTTYAYTIKLLCEEKYFEKYVSVATNVFKSLTLQQNAKTVPSGFNGIYHLPTNVLTIYPRDWKTTTGGDYYTTSYANTFITVTFSASIDNFAGMDKTTYNKVMQKTIPNFSTAAFTNESGQVFAEGYYTENSVRYTVYNTIMNAKDFSINIVFISPEKEYATYTPIYTQMIQNVYLQEMKTTN